MPASFSKIAIVLLLGGALPVGNAAAADTLRLGGTGAAIGMLQQVGTEFTAITGVKVEVIPSLGSTGAVRALGDGWLDIAVPARPLKPDEAAAGLRQVEVLRTALRDSDIPFQPERVEKRRPCRDFCSRKTDLGRRYADPRYSSPT
jgi:ABC-type phosphate transport system substrate-binding protein